jgi:hypothetical protein
MPEPQEIEAFDVLQFYGVQLVTDKGYFKLEYRNSSNGYYGGNLEYNTKEYGHVLDDQDKSMATIVVSGDF